MAAEAGKKKKLFVALDPPEEARRGLVAWGERELADPALRVVPPPNLHVTLAFLGWRPEEDVARAGAIVNGLAAAAPEMAFAPEPVPVRWRGITTLYAVEVDSPDMAEIQAELEERLVAAGLYTPEKRPFWPHVTVARVRSEKGGKRRYREVARPPAGLPEELLGLFRGVRIALYRSQTKPQGAEYTPLAQLELPSIGGG